MVSEIYCRKGEVAPSPLPAAVFPVPDLRFFVGVPGKGDPPFEFEDLSLSDELLELISGARHASFSSNAWASCRCFALLSDPMLSRWADTISEDAHTDKLRRDLGSSSWCG
jgi:hypothetical protein